MTSKNYIVIYIIAYFNVCAFIDKTKQPMGYLYKEIPPANRRPAAY